jgi:hypothetical protein
MEKKLIIAAREGREEEMRMILEENNGINVNWKDSSGYTALHWACYGGHDKIVTMLLAHPDIDVNQKTNGGYTSFVFACSNGKTACAQLMLKNESIKVNEPSNKRHTPLWCAARCGQLGLIKWWIASGREMDLGEFGNQYNDAIEIAKKWRWVEVADLLAGFCVNPEGTRYEVKMGLGLFQETAAEFFALMIFFCDGLLEIKEDNTNEASRFFRMAKELPIELQMVLCYRVVGYSGVNIQGQQRELAFKQLTRKLLC